MTPGSVPFKIFDLRNILFPSAKILDQKQVYMIHFWHLAKVLATQIKILDWILLPELSGRYEINAAAAGFGSRWIHCVTSGNYKLVFGDGTRVRIQSSKYKNQIWQPAFKIQTLNEENEKSTCDCCSEKKETKTWKMVSQTAKYSNTSAKTKSTFTLKCDFSANHVILLILIDISDGWKSKVHLSPK